MLGFLVPLTLVAGVVGFVMAWLIVAILERFRLTRNVGNISLFFNALGVLLAWVYSKRKVNVKPPAASDVTGTPLKPSSSLCMIEILSGKPAAISA